MEFLKPIEVVNGGILRAAPTNLRFDATMLASHIMSADVNYILPVLGQGLYAYMVANRTTGTINYNTALGAIVPAFTDPILEAFFTGQGVYTLMCYAIVLEALPFVHFQITSTGVKVKDDQNSAAAQSEDVRYMADTMQTRINTLSRKIKEYLCANEATFAPFGFVGSEIGCKPSCCAGDKAQFDNDFSGFFIY